VQDVADVCGCPESAAAILMREHKWDKERLLESYVDDPARVQKKCGVLARCQGSNICLSAAKKKVPPSKIYASIARSAWTRTDSTRTK
jgi:hypothetical protein